MEEIILLAITHLGHDAYGVTIRHQVEEMVGKSYSVGAIYVPLDRLSQRGFLESSIGAPTPERGGRSKRYYHLTAKGLQALRDIKQLHDDIWAQFSDIDSLINPIT
jgi:PadR family transcriptional regulator PadR